MKEGWYLLSTGFIRQVSKNDASPNPWNCFPTKEDAERRQKLREAEDELYNLWLHITGGWEPNWDDYNHFVDSNLKADMVYGKRFPNYRFYKTKEQCQQAIELMSDHAKWYLREG